MMTVDPISWQNVNLAKAYESIFAVFVRKNACEHTNYPLLTKMQLVVRSYC